MKIHVYTLCWNEMDILPFCVDYWKSLGDVEVFVMDNGSTDGSVEYLKQFDWIHVIHFESNGFNDAVHKEIKNNIWKTSRGKADWVIVSDCDELLYSNHLEEELNYMNENGYTVLGNKWYRLIGDFKPEHDDTKLLHEQVIKGNEQCINWADNTIGKIMLFNPNKIVDMNYEVGAHKCTPTGDYKLYKSDKIWTIHIDKGFGVDYKMERYKILNERLSETNKKYQWGVHYGFPREEIERDYKEAQSHYFDLRELK